MVSSLGDSHWTSHSVGLMAGAFLTVSSQKSQESFQGKGEMSAGFDWGILIHS